MSHVVPPIPGNWGLWDDWSDCTEDCGGGTQEKSRVCDNPAPQGGGEDCQGRSYESRACNTFACPGNINNYGIFKNTTATYISSFYMT